jgi:uncharacterized protein (DUF2267 family)
MLIKAVYVDGWKIAAQGHRVRHVDDFILRVKDDNETAGHEDFTSDAQSLGAIQAVFRVIKSHVSEGEIEDVIRTLPENLRPLLG